MHTNTMQDIRSTLHEIERTIDMADFFPAASRADSEFSLDDPFAFLVASCLDRGTSSWRIWTIPADLKRALGHLDPERIAAMSTDSLERTIQGLPHKPRWPGAGRTVRELAQQIVDRFGSRAQCMWQGRTAQAFKADLQRLPGVGPHVSSMAVQLVLRAFGDVFSDDDRHDYDIKADVHTRRVLCRLGLIARESDAKAVQAARRLEPDHPGSLDAPLWWVGQTWCHASQPKCPECPLRESCAFAASGITYPAMPRACSRF